MTCYYHDADPFFLQYGDVVPFDFYYRTLGVVIPGTPVFPAVSNEFKRLQMPLDAQVSCSQSSLYWHGVPNDKRLNSKKKSYLWYNHWSIACVVV
jgi:hypothetical protein